MVQRHCAAGKTLQIVEFRPAVYVLAGRKAPHRFFFWTLPSLLGRPGKQMQADMIRMSYSDKRPDCIVFGAGAHWDSPLALEHSPARFGFTQVDSILEDPEKGIRMVLFRRQREAQ